MRRRPLLRAYHIGHEAYSTPMPAPSITTQDRKRSSRKRPRCGAVQHVCKGAVLLSLLPWAMASLAGGGPGGDYRPHGPPQRHSHSGECLEISKCGFVLSFRRPHAVKRTRVGTAIPQIANRKAAASFMYAGDRLNHIGTAVPRVGRSLGKVVRCNISTTLRQIARQGGAVYGRV